MPEMRRRTPSPRLGLGLRQLSPRGVIAPQARGPADAPKSARGQIEPAVVAIAPTSILPLNDVIQNRSCVAFIGPRTHMLPVRLGTLILLVGAPQPRYTGGLKPGQGAGLQGPLTTTYPRVTQLSTAS